MFWGGVERGRCGGTNTRPKEKPFLPLKWAAGGGNCEEKKKVTGRKRGEKKENWGYCGGGPTEKGNCFLVEGKKPSEKGKGHASEIWKKKKGLLGRGEKQCADTLKKKFSSSPLKSVPGGLEEEGEANPLGGRKEGDSQEEWPTGLVPREKKGIQKGHQTLVAVQGKK